MAVLLSSAAAAAHHAIIYVLCALRSIIMLKQSVRQSNLFASRLAQCAIPKRQLQAKARKENAVQVAVAVDKSLKQFRSGLL
jgi:hypothetical protein